MLQTHPHLNLTVQEHWVQTCLLYILFWLCFSPNSVCCFKTAPNVSTGKERFAMILTVRVYEKYTDVWRRMDGTFFPQRHWMDILGGNSHYRKPWMKLPTKWCLCTALGLLWKKYGNFCQYAFKTLCKSSPVISCI